MPFPSATLGTVVRSRRMLLGLTQEDLAERIGARQSDVSRLECDMIALPRSERLRALAAALGMTPGELLQAAGWIGADPTRRDEPQVRIVPVDPGPAQPHGVLEHAPVHAGSSRLERALAQSRDIRSQTVALMARSVESRDNWSECRKAHDDAQPARLQGKRRSPSLHEDSA